MKSLKSLVTLSLIIALIFVSAPVQQSHGQDAAAACIVAVIGIGCAGFLVYGLYRMCQHIPAPETEPPPWAPISQLPGLGPPTYLHPLPPLKMRNQLFAAQVSFQHNDNTRAGWQTDYTFVPTDSQIGGMAMVAYDASGTPVMTNDVPITSLNGESWVSFDFTMLPPAFTNSPALRMFRLLSQ
jgi:hypothetical protein